MSEFFYDTIEKNSSCLFKEKQSKFYGFAFPVETESEVKQVLEKLKKDHSKANHFCYAYRIGIDHNLFRISDDGEPSGTAGKPILGQIDKLNLSNCLVVIVRYFGGIKLGSNGLIQAYKETAATVLEGTTVKRIWLVEQLTVKTHISLMNEFIQKLKNISGQLIDIKIESEFVSFVIELKTIDKNSFIQQCSHWKYFELLNS